MYNHQAVGPSPRGHVWEGLEVLARHPLERQLKRKLHLMKPHLWVSSTLVIDILAQLQLLTRLVISAIERELWFQALTLPVKQGRASGSRRQEFQAFHHHSSNSYQNYFQVTDKLYLWKPPSSGRGYHFHCSIMYLKRYIVE